jgi:O-antigen/teichoic acid export membrane protein
VIKQNIIANLVGRFWSFISLYLFVPLYLKFLGIEAYGLVGFYSMLLGILAFADMGFSTTINREMARLSVCKESAGEMRDLLRTYESTYLVISLTVAIFIWLLAPMVATYWLQAQHMPHTEIVCAIRVMGVAIAFQMPASLYVGGLMGLQRQVLTNAIQIFWGVFRGVGVVLVLWLFSPTIFVFALWQVISNVIYCFLLRFNLWRTLAIDFNKAKFNGQVLYNTWRYAAGMFSMTMMSVILTQIDKLAVSRLLPLEMLGYYTLAGALAAGLISLGSPIASAIFPPLTGLVALKDRSGLERLYHKSCEIIAVIIIPGGLTLVFFSSNFIFAWTGSSIIANKVGMAASFLLGGQLLQAITLIPCYLALAHGSFKLILKIDIASILLVTPLLPVLIKKYGIEGAGASWLILNICTFLPYMYFLHKSFLPGEFWRWFLLSVLKPTLVSISCVFLGYLLMPAKDSRFLIFCAIGVVWSFSMIATATAVPELRYAFKRQVSKYSKAIFRTT